MPNAVRVHEAGGADALQWGTVEVGAPGRGEVQIRHTAVGLNFIDVYHRTGLYPLPTPFIPGLEGAGVVESVGEGAPGLQVGDRVAYGAGPLGAYAEIRNLPAERLVKIPEGVNDTQAAAMMLQGMTVEYLLRRTYRVQAGDTVLNPRSRRWRRPDRLPVGQAPRCDRDRHGGKRREGGAGSGPRLRASGGVHA